ncbi:MAG: DUF5688 family protein [Clostridiales bacterium]|nr:DUF5688 family protein [Clostridiales bacterium]
MKNVRMTKSEFCRVITAILDGKLEGCELVLGTDVEREDEKEYVLHVVIKKSQVIFRVRLNEAYDAYCLGLSIAQIIDKIISSVTISDNSELKEIISTFDEYEKVKDRLSIRLCNINSNREYLKGKLYSVHGNFAAVYFDNAYKDGVAMREAVVTPDHLKQWDVPLNAVHRDALKNMNKEAVLFSFKEVVLQKKRPRNLLDQDEKIGRDLLVLTNHECNNGSALMLDGSIMKKAADLFGGDFYIIPSSVHEVLLFPALPQFDRNEIIKIVVQGNRTVINKNDFLSDIPLYYHADTGLVTDICF